MDLTSPILKPRPTFTPLVYRTLVSDTLMTGSVMKKSTNTLSMVIMYSMAMLCQTGFTIYVSALEVKNTIWRTSWRASCEISLRRGGINLSFLRKRVYSYRMNFALWNQQIERHLKSCGWLQLTFGILRSHLSTLNRRKTIPTLWCLQVPHNASTNDSELSCRQHVPGQIRISIEHYVGFMVIFTVAQLFPVYVTTTDLKPQWHVMTTYPK
jgi:hypothetical protein